MEVAHNNSIDCQGHSNLLMDPGGDAVNLTDNGYAFEEVIEECCIETSEIPLEDEVASECCVETSEIPLGDEVGSECGIETSEIPLGDEVVGDCCIENSTIPLAEEVVVGQAPKEDDATNILDNRQSSVPSSQTLENGNDESRCATPDKLSSLPSDTEVAVADSSIPEESVVHVDDSFSDDEIDTVNSPAMPLYMKFAQVEPLEVKQEDELPHLSDELKSMYRFLTELMSDNNRTINWPFMEPVDLENEDLPDYETVVTNPMCLRYMHNKLVENQYESITQFVTDFRLVFENCYKYYGPNHSRTKKCLRVEQMLEENLELLPKEVQALCTLEVTSGRPLEEVIPTSRRSSRVNPGNNFFSHVLYRVKDEKSLREKENKKKQSDHRRALKEEKEKDVILWEEKLLAEPLGSEMRAMWELPQIGHFVYMTLRVLNISEVPQYELERMLLMPQASKTLSMLMTALLSSPTARLKLDKLPFMPYSIWMSKVHAKLSHWYRVYQREHQNSQKVFEMLGIEPHMWNILGSHNPMDSVPFHDLTFHQKVWILKSICDFLLHKHKKIQEAINDQPPADQHEYFLGKDEKGNRYIHFPQFCGLDLRIYRITEPQCPQESEDEKKRLRISRKRKQDDSDNEWGSKRKSVSRKKQKTENDRKENVRPARSLRKRKQIKYESEDSESEDDSESKSNPSESEVSESEDEPEEKPLEKPKMTLDEIPADIITAGRLTRSRVKQICEGQTSALESPRVAPKKRQARQRKSIKPEKNSAEVLQAEGKIESSEKCELLEHNGCDSSKVTSGPLSETSTETCDTVKEDVHSCLKDLLSKVVNMCDEQCVKVESGDDIPKTNESQDVKTLPRHDPSPYKPDISSFELIIDSVDGLREFVDKLRDNAKQKQDEAASRGEKWVRPKCEVELEKNASNLLEELEPWEGKLQAARKRLRTRLRREWEDYLRRDENKPDPSEDAWRSHHEAEEDDEEKEKEKEREKERLKREKERVMMELLREESEGSMDVQEEEGSFRRRLRKRRAKEDRKVVIDWDEDSNDSSECFEPSTWSRRKLRRMMMPNSASTPLAPQPTRRSARRRPEGDGSLSQNLDLIWEHSTHNNRNSASKTLEWEKYRQTLVKSPQKSDSGSPENLNNNETKLINQPTGSTPIASRNQRVIVQNLGQKKVYVLTGQQAAQLKKDGCVRFSEQGVGHIQNNGTKATSSTGSLLHSCLTGNALNSPVYPQLRGTNSVSSGSSVPSPAPRPLPAILQTRSRAQSQLPPMLQAKNSAQPQKPLTPLIQTSTGTVPLNSITSEGLREVLQASLKKIESGETKAECSPVIYLPGKSATGNGIYFRMAGQQAAQMIRALSTQKKTVIQLVQKPDIRAAPTQFGVPVSSVSGISTSTSVSKSVATVSVQQPVTTMNTEIPDESTRPTTAEDSDSNAANHTQTSTYTSVPTGATLCVTSSNVSTSQIVTVSAQATPAIVSAKVVPATTKLNVPLQMFSGNPLASLPSTTQVRYVIQSPPTANNVPLAIPINSNLPGKKVIAVPISQLNALQGTKVPLLAVPQQGGRIALISQTSQQSSPAAATAASISLAGVSQSTVQSAPVSIALTSLKNAQTQQVFKPSTMTVSHQNPTACVNQKSTQTLPNSVAQPNHDSTEVLFQDTSPEKPDLGLIVSPPRVQAAPACSDVTIKPPTMPPAADSSPAVSSNNLLNSQSKTESSARTNLSTPNGSTTQITRPKGQVVIVQDGQTRKLAIMLGNGKLQYLSNHHFSPFNVRSEQPATSTPSIPTNPPDAKVVVEPTPQLTNPYSLSAFQND